MSTNKRLTGTIKNYNRVKDTGCIISDNGEEIFVNRSCLQIKGPFLFAGKKVTFNIGKDMFGRRYAGNVVVIREDKPVRNNVDNGGNMDDDGSSERESESKDDELKDESINESINDRNNDDEFSGPNVNNNDVNTGRSDSIVNYGNWHFGRVIKYSDESKEGIILFNNERIKFNIKNCDERIDFRNHCNVTFKRRVTIKVSNNIENELHEAINIKKDNHEILDGYVTFINKGSQYGRITYKRYIRKEGTIYSKTFKAMYCHNFNKLVVGDCVRFERHAGAGYDYITAVELNDKGNIVKKGAKGIVRQVIEYPYDENKDEGYTLIFVNVRDFKRDICCRLDRLNVKLRNDSPVVMDIHRNPFPSERITNDLYGKYIKADVYDIYAKIDKRKKKQQKQRSMIGFKTSAKPKVSPKSKPTRTDNVVSPKKHVNSNAKSLPNTPKKRTNKMIPKSNNNNNSNKNNTKSPNNNTVNPNKIGPITPKKKFNNIAGNTGVNNETNNKPVKRDNVTETKIPNGNGNRNGNRNGIKSNKSKNNGEIITQAMIDNIAKQINELTKQHALMVKKFNAQKNGDSNSENNSEICSNDNVSDYNGSINGSQYSHQ